MYKVKYWIKNAVVTSGWMGREDALHLIKLLCERKDVEGVLVYENN